MQAQCTYKYQYHYDNIMRYQINYNFQNYNIVSISYYIKTAEVLVDQSYNMICSYNLITIYLSVCVLLTKQVYYIVSKYCRLVITMICIIISQFLISYKKNCFYDNYVIILMVILQCIIHNIKYLLNVSKHYFCIN